MNADFLVGWCCGALFMWVVKTLLRPRKPVLTLHDSSGFTPDMDVRVSSGDGSEQ